VWLSYQITKYIAWYFSDMWKSNFTNIPQIFVHLVSFLCFSGEFDGYIPIHPIGIFVLLLNMYAQFRIASFLTFRFFFSIFEF